MSHGDGTVRRQRFLRSRYLAAGILAGIVIASVGLGKAGVPSLYRPLVHMQRVMGMRVARHAPAEHWFRQVKFGYMHPPHRRAWRCIHHYEPGAWWSFKENRCYVPDEETEATAEAVMAVAAASSLVTETDSTDEGKT